MLCVGQRVRGDLGFKLRVLRLGGLSFFLGNQGLGCRETEGQPSHD